METNTPLKINVFKIALTKVIPVLLLLWAGIFLPAWTLNFWQGWVYLGVLLLPMAAVFLYMAKTDPELVERRLQMKEKDSGQKTILRLSSPLFVLAYILPGFDVRLGWSNVPAVVSIFAAGLVLVGYYIFFRVIKENRFASRVIEVAQGQKVIDTGPYALVRHPMYSGMILLYVMTPLALGSYWALIPAVAIIPLIAARSIKEEGLLAKELPGYEGYLKKVRYRLLPGVW